MESAAEKWEILTRATSPGEIENGLYERAWSKRIVTRNHMVICTRFYGLWGKCRASKEKVKERKENVRANSYQTIQSEERKMRLSWGLPSCCQCLSVLFNERSIFCIYCRQPDASTNHTSVFVVCDSVQKSRAKLFTVCFLPWKGD